MHPLRRLYEPVIRPLLEVEGMTVPPDAGEVGAEALELSMYSAVRLFTQSAERVEAGFAQRLSERDRAAVARICRLVGGMPLGLELAAAWLRALPVADLAGAGSRLHLPVLQG